jgi:membrane-associated PAP2 superfamily phosphatase
MLVQKDWRQLVWWPGIAFVSVLAAIIFGHFDRPIAQLFFFHAPSGWIGAGAGDWWAHDLIHSGGRWIPRIVAALGITGWLASFKVAQLAAWRRELLFVIVGMGIVIGLVGLMKHVTNVDCPWDLAGFGGDRPYVGIFDDRPDSLPHAACFPGAHSSSGFALLAFYFALRRRARRAALWALALSVAIGVTFSIGQEARGAHFLSHDLSSAALSWLVLVWLYSRMLAPQPANSSQVQAREREREHAARQAANDIA